MSFNRTKSRAVIGLLTGHNTTRRHLHVMGLRDNPTCKKCRAKEETSVHILCECEALGYWVWGAPGTLSKEQGSYNRVQNRGYRGPVLRPRCVGLERVRTPIFILQGAGKYEL